MPDTDKTKPAAPVKIVDQTEPVPVVVTETIPAPVALVEKGHGFTASPKSTEEEDRHSASQRQINRYWERVQGYIAVLVTTTACGIAVLLVWRGEYALGVGLISSMVFLVVGFYFGRSNHERVGGVQLPNYQGR